MNSKNESIPYKVSKRRPMSSWNHKYKDFEANTFGVFTGTAKSVCETEERVTINRMETC